MPLFKKNDLKDKYSEKIPERLVPEQFQVHETFRHGFPFQPSCLAYDCIQKLLAIGSHSGAIAIIGQSGLETHCQLPSGVGALQLQFVQNKGLLVCRCNNNTLCLISLRDRRPLITHRLEFQRENHSHIYCPYGSDWLYVGMEEGNVYIVNVMEFQLSGYTIYWDKTVEQGLRKSRPGDVLSIEEHPQDNSKILIAFTGGLCTLWNLKTKSGEKRFYHDTGKSMGILMSVSWHGSGKTFSAAYSNGTICLFNVKNEGKPERIETPHGVSGNSPIAQMKIFYTEPEPWTIFSGGYPEFDSSSIKTVTFQTSQQSHLISFKDSIVEFICLPSSPFASDHQKTFALAVLTHSEILLYDLQSPGIPNFNFPLSFDIHRSPVTSIVYAGNCPDDFIAQLHSVKSKLPHQPASIKQWPIKGGKWGQESPDPWTDLIMTGHLDGTVRVWFCRSVIMQPLFTLSTSFYFEAQPVVTDPSPHPSPKPPLRNLSGQSIPEEETLPILTPPTSTTTTPPEVMTTPPEVKILVDDADETPSEATPTGENSSSPEGVAIERKSVSSKEKKSFLKSIKSKSKRHKNKKKSLANSDETHPHEDEDGEGEGGGDSDLEESSKTPPPKPKDLPILGGGAMSSKRKTKVFSRKTSTDSLKAVAGSIPDEGPLSTTSTSSLKTPEDYVVVSLVNTTLYKKSEELAVHQMSMCPYARNLCVGNISGHVMMFHFSMTPSDSKPKTLWINMLRDSVIINESLPDETKERMTTPLMFNSDMTQQLPGYYVRQHCFCYRRGEGAVMSPVDVTSLKYWEQAGLLAIGTDSGLVIVNTTSNQVLQTLGTLTSILYLADPGNYSRQVRKLTHELPQKLHKSATSPDYTSLLMEKKLSVPFIVPSMELPHMESSPALITSSPLPNKVKVNRQTSGAVPSEHLVTCIELVQFFLTKTHVPSTTLWVATYSGHISVYTINTVISRGKPTTEIHPTGLIIERKSPVVELHFLSEWGEQLVSPYKIQKEGKQESVTVLRRRQTAKEIKDAEKPVNYVAMVTKESVRTVGFPGNHLISQVDISSTSTSSHDTSHIIRSGIFTCDTLPCLLTLVSDGLILIHTLPGLKPMLRYQYESLNNSRALYTFRISGNGQALYQASSSQFQRLSVTKHDNLNIPLSLPEMYLPIENPSQVGKGMFNQLLGAITTPTSTDKEKIFGVEAAGKAWKSVAKRDDLLSPTDGGRRGRGGGGGARGRDTTDGGSDGQSNGGAPNAFTKAREALDERGKKLSKTEEITEKMKMDADDFASVAERLAEKYRKKRF